MLRERDWHARLRSVTFFSPNMGLAVVVSAARMGVGRDLCRTRRLEGSGMMVDELIDVVP
jgi:hypothetical protein